MRACLIPLALLAFARVAFGAAEADLLVAFDNSYTDGVGGDDNAEVLTANSVAASNWINDRSGTGGRMRIAAYHKTWWQGGRSTLGGYVGWLWNYGDGYLDDVTAAADAAGADLVAFICAPVAGETSAAVAQQPGRYAAYGTGSFWNNVVAHETGGHNYGCDHRGGRLDPKTIMLHNYCGGGSQGYFSNPNIWLNGVRLLGEGSCLGDAVSGGDNAYLISTTAQGVADRNERVVWGSHLGAVQYRWQFNKPAAAAPAGTVVASDVGGAQATVRGQGATFTGTGLRLPGGTTGNTAADSIAAYLDLPNGIFSAMPNFTIEIWATPLSAQNWMRVVDIGRPVQAGDGLGADGEYTGLPGSAAPGSTQASDNLMLTAGIGTDLNNQRFEVVVDGANRVTFDSNLGTTAGQRHHYAITFTDTSTGSDVAWYRDGVRVKSGSTTFHSSQIEDVNNWLGRSMWSGDAMSHIEYHDVRIQSTALNAEQVAQNYRIGPHDAVSTLWANDGWGNSGFLSGAWEFGATPVPSRDYETGAMRLLAPWATTDSTFPGKSLAVTGGSLFLAGKDSNTVTINDLRLNGGTIISLGDGGSAQTLAGNINVRNYTDNQVRGAWGPLTITANLSGGVGGGGMLYTESAVTLAGNNSAYQGATLVGDGRFGTLRISSETNLGGNPTYYGGAWLNLNRGILETTATMAIDDANRGIVIGPSGGVFRPAAGTTLTIATTLNSPAAGNTLQTAPMDSNPIQGIFIKEGGGTLVLTHPNNSHNAEMQIQQGELRLEGNGRINNGDHWMPVTLNSTLNYNSTATQTLRGVISGNGTLVKNNTGTLNINGSNSFSGSVTVNGGTLYANPGNAAANRAFSFVSGITVNNGGTLRSGTNGLFGWDGTQEKPITVNAGGTLTTNGGLVSDVGVGSVTLNGGTLASLAGGAADWGSWRFDQATDKLRVTQNSTASATNVKFGDPGAAIEVAAGKTLDFTGTITDATNGGTSYLTKTGTGTLLLAGANTHSGATAVNAGTLRLNGSIAAGSTVSVASGATLSGTGTVSGALAVAGGASHAPGDPAGTQTVGGALAYASGSRLQWTLVANSDASGAASRVAAGNVNVTPGARIDVRFNVAGGAVGFTDAFWSRQRTWTVISASTRAGSFSLGTVSGDSAGRPLSDFGTLELRQVVASVTLVFTPYTPTELWRRAWFGVDWNNPAISGDAVDGDKDGLSNLLEYALGSDPNACDPRVAPQVATGEGKLQITFTRNAAASDLILSVLAADDLAGTWTEIARSAGGAPFETTVTGAAVSEQGSGELKAVKATDIYLIVDPAHPKRFLRLAVSR